MARIRTIKPEFWTAEQVMELSRDARLLFVGMWNFCDDAGVHPAAYKTLKAEVFPGDDITSSDIKTMVSEIIAQGLLCEFEHDGRCWWYVTGWKHQLINRPTPSRYPKPPRTAPPPLAAGRDGSSGKGLDEQIQPEAQAESGGDSVQLHAVGGSESTGAHGALTESSVSTHGVITEDSLQEGKGKEGKGKERKGQDQKHAQHGGASDDPKPEKPAAVAAVRFNAAEFLVDQGADEQTAADYLLLRRGKKAASTATAMRQVVAEAGKSGMTLQAALALCCARGWAGFQASWADQQARAGPRQSIHDQRKATLDELTGRSRHDPQTDPRDITAEVIRIA